MEVDFSFRVWDIFLSRLSKDVCGLGGRLHVWASYPVPDVVWESLTISATERLSRSIAVVLLDMAQGVYLNLLPWCLLDMAQKILYRDVCFLPLKYLHLFLGQM